MPKKNFIVHRGVEIRQGDRAIMPPNSPFGNGNRRVEIEIIAFKRTGPGNYNVGVAADRPIGGWHELDGRVPPEHGYWISPIDLFKYFLYKGSPHPLQGKRTEVENFKFRKKNLNGMKCKILASLPDGKSSFVEMAEDIGGCGSDGLGKAGHCIVVPNNKIVEAKPKKKAKPRVKSKST